MRDASEERSDPDGPFSSQPQKANGAPVAAGVALQAGNGALTPGASYSEMRWIF
jgi:hypothetical protein